MARTTPRRQPRYKITRWMRLKSRFRRWTSPFLIRETIYRLRYHHTWPWLAFLQLINPFPRWSYPIPPPLSPQSILQDPSLVLERAADLVNLTSMPIWCWRDTPIRAVYRLYEAMMADDYALMGPETEHIFRQTGRSWSMQRIQDPHDGDPVRYAIIASLVEELVTACNWRLGLGLRRNRKHVYRDSDEDPYPPFVAELLPSWTKSVPPIKPEMLEGFPERVLDGKGNLVLEEKGVSETFGKRNIITNVGWLYTI